MKTMFPIVPVLAIVVAGSAWAESPAAAKARAEIAKDYAKGDFEQVVKKVDAALKKATESTEIAQLQVLRAQALLALGQSDKARAAFGAAVQKDPTVELDASHASPDAVRMLDRVRGELPATLVVLVKAGHDADVAVDDKDLGPAPLQTQVPGGVHVVLAKGADGRTTRVEAQVPPGRKVVLELELKPGAGVKSVAVAPPREALPSPGTAGTAGASGTSADGTVAEVSQPVVLQPVEPEVSRAMPAVRPASMGLWIGGGVVAIAGAVALWQAGVQYERLNNPTGATFAPGEGEAVARTGQTLQALGWVGVGAGLLAAGAGGLLWWLDWRASAPKVGLMVTPTGVWVSVYGVMSLGVL